MLCFIMLSSYHKTNSNIAVVTNGSVILSYNYYTYDDYFVQNEINDFVLDKFNVSTNNVWWWWVFFLAN